jgi:hypothetical protein
LLAEIEKSEKKDQEERDRVKSMGGTRLKIEDTDGSEDEAAEEEKLNILANESTPTIANSTSSGQSNQIGSQMKEIKIAEVESDDDDDYDESDDHPEKETKRESEKEEKIRSEIQQTPPEVKTSAVAKFKLDPKLIEEKDKAFSLYKNGHYAESVQHYTTVIESLLKEISKYTGSELTLSY